MRTLCDGEEERGVSSDERRRGALIEFPLPHVLKQKPLDVAALAGCAKNVVHQPHNIGGDTATSLADERTEQADTSLDRHQPPRGIAIRCIADDEVVKQAVETEVRRTKAGAII